jgi:lipopolysaccharide/colanic/teichoic acid biosynthesis glycosyltransferase
VTTSIASSVSSHVVFPETQTSSRRLYYVIKRGMDVAMAAALLVLLSPLMLLIAALIRMDSPGPTLFVQTRIGSRRRSSDGTTRWDVCPFQFYKFRSMIVDADPSLHQAHIAAFVAGREEVDEEGRPAIKVLRDPRLTRVGRVLRKWSLDELPQLVNVLKGEMSLVGPRPVPGYEVGAYQEWHYGRLAATPGMTGLWQVKGRCELSFDEMIRLDLDYVRKQSLAMDLKILVLTIPAMLSRRGAE